MKKLILSVLCSAALLQGSLTFACGCDSAEKNKCDAASAEGCSCGKECAEHGHSASSGKKKKQKQKASPAAAEAPAAPQQK